MQAVDLIVKKRDKGELSREEIEFFIQGFARGEIPDYQAAAWAMAVLLNGMTVRETTYLTLAMAHSGQVLDLSKEVGFAIDKHSSGGVGDKTSLVVLPVVAACGLPIGKMSGRGLGFSGGTLDKMESIPGYRCDLSIEEFKRQLKEIGLVLTGQSPELAPADGKLYALRDVTGTVPSIPLIAASIMSKKIAAGAPAIVLDVKVGTGAFMNTLIEARQLARLMIDIGRLAGRQVVTILSDMNQPLGHSVGNALEVQEAIETLRGGGPPDFRAHCLYLSAQMLKLGGKAVDLAPGQRMAEAVLANGAALDKFRLLVQAQAGDVTYIDDPNRLPKARLIEPLLAERNGYLAEVNARIVGEVAVLLGAGRSRKGEAIDHAVGLVIPAKVGDAVEAGQPLAILHANHPDRLAEAHRRLKAAFQISPEPVSPLPHFYPLDPESSVE